MSTNKRIMPTLGKNASLGLNDLLNSVNLQAIVNNKQAIAAYQYIQALNDAINSDEYKERQQQKNEWIKQARKDGRYTNKGKV